MKNSARNTPTRCFRYGRECHLSYNCLEKPNQQNLPGQNSNQKAYPRSANTGKLNHVSAETASVEPEVMLGAFDVHSTPATVLFYSGASHPFISQDFVKTHSISLYAMKNPIIVNSPRGIIPASYCCLPISLILRG
jgi:hypothetical protein